MQLGATSWSCVTEFSNDIPKHSAVVHKNDWDNHYDTLYQYSINCEHEFQSSRMHNCTARLRKEKGNWTNDEPYFLPFFVVTAADLVNDQRLQSGKHQSVLLKEKYHRLSMKPLSWESLIVLFYWPFWGSGV